MRHRISFEIPALSESLRAAYPQFPGLRALCVSESRYWGLLGCDLARVMWRCREHEWQVVTAETMAQCIDHLDALLDEYSAVGVLLSELKEGK